MLVLSPATPAADMAQDEEHQPWSSTPLTRPGQEREEENMEGSKEGE